MYWDVSLYICEYCVFCFKLYVDYLWSKGGHSLLAVDNNWIACQLAPSMELS